MILPDPFSNEGAVCARGVVGLRDFMLSSEELLSWRASVFASPAVSCSAGELTVCSTFGGALLVGGSREERVDSFTNPGVGVEFECGP